MGGIDGSNDVEMAAESLDWNQKVVLIDQFKELYQIIISLQHKV